MRRPISTPKALLIESKNANQQYGDGLHFEDEPSTTVITDSKPSHQPKAFLVDGQLNGFGTSITTVNGETRYFTVKASMANQVKPKAWLEQGRVVRMTSRALARFQTIPDWYELPEKNVLACKVIGNGVPCKLAQVVIESLLPLH